MAHKSIVSLCAVGKTLAIDRGKPSDMEVLDGVADGLLLSSHPQAIRARQRKPTYRVLPPAHVPQVIRPPPWMTQIGRTAREMHLLHYPKGSSPFVEDQWPHPEQPGTWDEPPPQVIPKAKAMPAKANAIPEPPPPPRPWVPKATNKLQPHHPLGPPPPWRLQPAAGAASHSSTKDEPPSSSSSKEEPSTKTHQLVRVGRPSAAKSGWHTPKPTPAPPLRPKGSVAETIAASAADAAATAAIKQEASSAPPKRRKGSIAEAIAAADADAAAADADAAATAVIKQEAAGHSDSDADCVLMAAPVSSTHGGPNNFTKLVRLG
jgi:hypothetical protein